MKTASRSLSLLLALATAALAASCAVDVGDIDRTQHDKLEKSLFGGVWYMTQTVVDIPYNAAFSFVGETNFGSVGKVLFDIQEKMLVVYPVSETVVGAEKKWHREKLYRYWDDACLSRDAEAYGCVDGVDNAGRADRICCFAETYVGQPLAAFEILSHFDVQRQYNAQTGEQSNVIEENTTDRLWWQRGYIRVNWAKNLVNDFSFMARVAAQTPIDYYVQSFEAGNPDAPTLTDDYIDVVTKVYGEPESSGGCDIYGVSLGDCASAVVKFRTAFRKVDPAMDYEPLRYHNEDEQAWFGFFLTERPVYDEDFGHTYSGRLSFANRWNVWKGSFDETDLFLDGVTDAHGQPIPRPCYKYPSEDLQAPAPVACAEDADCGAIGGRCLESRCVPAGCDAASGGCGAILVGCDPANVDGAKEFCRADDWLSGGRCVLRTTRPYARRSLKPVVYHVSDGLPDNLWSGALRTAQAWSDTLKETVSWLYLWEERDRIRGQDVSRACATDAECAGHALVDTWVEIDTTVWRNDAGKLMRQPAKTIVATQGSAAGVTVVDWGFPDAFAGKASVRFLNVSGEPASLSVAGVAVETDAPALPQATEDATVPAHHPAEPGEGVTLVVTGANGAKFEATATLQADSVTTVVFDGADVLASTARANDIWGLRFINALGVAVDVSVNGGLRMLDVAHGRTTGYQMLGGGSPFSKKTGLPADWMPQRVVAVPAGERGDLTCYRSQQISRCVGYRPGMTASDWERLEEIKASLPPLFVMCRNRHDAVDDQWKSNLYGTWEEIEAARKAGTLAELPVKDPCVDFLFGADGQDDATRQAAAAALKKAGDSRYSMIYWVPEPQLVGPLGYGPSAADPDTGEIFWATANIYGAALRTYIALTRDLFDLVNGNLDPDRYISGAAIRDYVTGRTTSTTGKATSALATPGDDAYAAQAPSHEAGIDPATLAVHLPGIIDRDVIKVLRDPELLAAATKNLPAVAQGVGKARLQSVRGTKYESLLMSGEMQLAASAQGDDAGSPLEWANLEDLLKKEHERQIVLGQHAYCMAQFGDEGVIGMARQWGCMPGDARPDCGADWDPLDHANDEVNKCCIRDGDRLLEALLLRNFVAVVEHEVGHTVGLRHNFAGSSDVFNFPDRYYDVREKDAIPCGWDGDCYVLDGEYCKDGWCRLEPRTAECASAKDCGDASLFECRQSRCWALERCGIHGECTGGGSCDGDAWTCVGADGKRAARQVEALTDDRVRKLAPRPGMTEGEAAKSRNIYQVSTIMDYGQRWNSDILDLGKYDYAAIRFGYGRLMDIYEDLRKMQDSVYREAAYYGQSLWNSSGNLETYYWNDGVSTSQFMYLDHLIGVDANRSEGAFKRNRSAVPYEWVKYGNDITYGFYREGIDRTFINVPYKFCSDEYNGNLGCYTWDTGIDPLEIVHSMNIQLQDYYLVDAFKRERYGFGLGGSPSSYLSRIVSRYMDPMRNTGTIYGLYSHYLKNIPGYRALWMNNRLMGYGLRRASETAFETLANSLASPSPGSYLLDEVAKVYGNFSYAAGQPGSDLDIALGTGKYPYTTFLDDAGYFYWDHAAWIGSFWEKLGALMTLTDSSVMFTTDYVGEQLNIGVGTSIGFNTLYPRQLVELFGGIIAGDTDRYAWTVDGKGASGRTWFDPDNPDAYASTIPPPGTPSKAPVGLPIVKPSIDNLTLKVYAALYGMAYLPASFDPSFLDSLAVCLKGSGECIDLAPTSGIVAREFVDPFGGKTYVAWGPVYQADWYAPNLSLVDRANALRATWEAAATDAERAVAAESLKEVIEVLDLVRDLYQRFSRMQI